MIDRNLISPKEILRNREIAEQIVKRKDLSLISKHLTLQEDRSFTEIKHLANGNKEFVRYKLVYRGKGLALTVSKGKKDKEANIKFYPTARYNGID